MDLNIRDLRVLVTAGASGIGLATARAFVREGARVHVCDIDDAALDALATRGVQLSRAPCAMRGGASIGRLFERNDALLGGLDVLVNNAGIAGPTAPCEDVTHDAWERTRARYI